MINLRNLLKEVFPSKVMREEESEAAKQAHGLGLVSKGWGLWADPQTNKIVAKTIDGHLVKAKPNDDGKTDYYDPGDKSEFWDDRQNKQHAIDRQKLQQQLNKLEFDDIDLEALHAAKQAKQQQK
jgi:ABC-type Zn2+ transport system substrate-binding protein/surface adhesin